MSILQDLRTVTHSAVAFRDTIAQCDLFCHSYWTFVVLTLKGESLSSEKIVWKTASITMAGASAGHQNHSQTERWMHEHRQYGQLYNYTTSVTIWLIGCFLGRKCLRIDSQFLFSKKHLTKNTLEDWSAWCVQGSNWFAELLQIQYIRSLPEKKTRLELTTQQNSHRKTRSELFRSLLTWFQNEAISPAAGTLQQGDCVLIHVL